MIVIFREEDLGAGAGNGKLIGNPFDLFGLDGVDWRATADSTGSSYVGVLFQLTFAAITVARSGLIAVTPDQTTWPVISERWRSSTRITCWADLT